MMSQTATRAPEVAEQGTAIASAPPLPSGERAGVRGRRRCRPGPPSFPLLFLRGLALTLLPLPAFAQAKAGWGGVGKDADKGFSWTAPLWPEFWMAWTPATFALFVGIFGAMAVLTVIEIRHPGGDERMGVLGLTTTRGDRLFITLLGTSYIFLAWLGLVGMPLWGPLGLAILWGAFTFWKV